MKYFRAKNFKTILSVVTTLVLLSGATSVIAKDNNVANLNNYIKIDGATGISKIKGLEGYSTLSSWSFAANVYEKKPAFQDIYITTNDQDSSAMLLKAMVTAKVIPTVTIVVVSAYSPTDKIESFNKVVFKFVMHNVTVTSFQSGNSDGSLDIYNSISLTYESANYEAGEFDKNQKASPEHSIYFVVPKKPVYPQQQ